MFAAALVAVLAYLLIERRLHLREERMKREEVVRDVLEIISLELRHDLKVADQLTTNLAEGYLSHPPFDVNGWTFISQAPVLTALESDTLEGLTKAYNRLRIANELYWEISDLRDGATAALVHLLGTSEEARKPLGQFYNLRDQRTEQFVVKVQELRPVVERVAAHVERQLASR